MDSRQLRYFVAICEQGSLSAAAARERVAVSALSYHLANMEAELARPLFTRKPRGLAPNAAGLRLLAHARAITRAIETAARDVRAAGEEPAGEVSVGMAFSAVKAIGVSLARRVLADLPKVRLTLTESLSGATLMQLMAADVELALVYNPPAAPNLSAVPVLEERMVLLGLPSVIGEGPEPVSVEALLDMPIILLRQGLSARALMDDSALLKKLEARAMLQMNSVQAISGAVEAGLGAVIGTRLFMRERLDAGAVALREIGEPALTRRLYLCALEDRPPSFAQEAMRGLILELLKDSVESGAWDARLL